MAKLHWTQTPEGRAKMSIIRKKVWANKKNEHFRQLAKFGAKTKRGPYKTTKKDKRATILIINGWKITVEKDEIRIDHE